jgi:hypothetical protein
MRRLVVAQLAVAAMLLAGPGTASAHDASFKTETSFGFYNGTPDAFLGEVSSPKAACERGRVVKVFRQRPGPDRLIGAIRSDSYAQWTVERTVPAGKYYAKVLKKRIAPRSHRHVCRAYRSSTLPFS